MNKNLFSMLLVSSLMAPSIGHAVKTGLSEGYSWGVYTEGDIASPEHFEFAFPNSQSYIRSDERQRRAEILQENNCQLEILNADWSKPDFNSKVNLTSGSITPLGNILIKFKDESNSAYEEGYESIIRIAIGDATHQSLSNENAMYYDVRTYISHCGRFSCDNLKETRRQTTGFWYENSNTMLDTYITDVRVTKNGTAQQKYKTLRFTCTKPNLEEEAPESPSRHIFEFGPPE